MWGLLLASGDPARVAAFNAMPAAPPVTPTPTELAKMQAEAMKEFITAFAKTAWKRWAGQAVKTLAESQLPLRSGHRRDRFLQAVAEMVQMVAHGVATGKQVELKPDNAAMAAAGAKHRLLNEADDMKNLMVAMQAALDKSRPAEQGDGVLIAPMVAGITKDDVQLLVRTALQWSFCSEDAVKPWEQHSGFTTVEPGRVTTSAQLPCTAGWTYEWHIRWDVARNVVHIGLTELPLSLPSAL